MKQILFILILLPTLTVSVYASTSSDVSAIESSIFGFDYSSESTSKRIERIEEHLYGTKKSGNLNKRLETIQNDIGFLSQDEKLSQEKVIKERQIIQQQKLIEEQRQKELAQLKEDSSVEYPMVDNLEQELFQKTYTSENIYSRLDRLEKKVFNRTSNDSLTNRVDKLSSAIGTSKPKRISYQDDYSSYSNDINSYYSNSGLTPIDDNSVPFQLAVLEQDLLNGNYNNDNVANRLNRLEQKLFKRTFSSDNDITRLQRIMVAYDAKQKSYKYENNRKMQNMATVSQIGGILLMILAMLL